LKLRVDRVMSLVDARQQYASQLVLNVHAEQFKNGFLTELKGLLTPYQGGACPVSLRYCRDDAETTIALGEGWQLRPEDEVLQELSHFLGKEKVMLEYN